MAIAEATTSASGRCWQMKMFYCYNIFNLCYVAHFKCFKKLLKGVSVILTGCYCNNKRQLVTGYRAAATQPTQSSLCSFLINLTSINVLILRKRQRGSDSHAL